MGLRQRAFVEKSLVCLLAAMAFSGAALHRQEGNGAGSEPSVLVPREKLVFGIQWNPPWYLFFLPDMQAGEAEVQVSQNFEYQGTRAFRILFSVHSSGTFVSLVGMKIDDTFEYIADAGSFCTIKATRRIREGKRKRDIEVVYLPETGRLHIRDVDLAVSPNKVKKDEYVNDIPKCVRDLFTALYWVRSGDRLQLGAVRSSIVGNDDKVKEIRSTVEKKEFVVTPAGRFEAWRLNTAAILGGLFKDGGQFRFWLTADSRMIPVQFEAKVNLGKVTGKLKVVETATVASR